MIRIDLTPGRAYYLLPVSLTSDRTVTIITRGDFIDVYQSTADLTKVYMSVDDGPALPLSSILPAEFAKLFSRITLSWEASEVGKSVTLLIGGEYKYRRHVEDVKIKDDQSTITPSIQALPPLIRWGRSVTLMWIYGSETVAPSAGSTLVSRTVASGRSGYVYGIYIAAGEGNDFRLQWTSGGSSRSILVPFSTKGAVVYVDIVPLNEGLPADPGSTIRIVVVNAGSSGVPYQAGILYAEV